MNIKLNIAFAISLTTSLSMVAASCSSNNPPSVEESKATKDVITLGAKMGATVPLAEAATQPTDYLVVLSGRIDFDPNKVTRVFPLVTGIVNHIYVNQGDVVHKGQVLAEVYSSDIANAVSDFQKSRSQYEIAHKALVRMKYLLESKLVAPSDLEQAESAEVQARADDERSLKTLKLLGGNENSSSMAFQITAPIDGTVVERLAQQGSQVRNDGGVAAFTIGSTSSIWVTLDAYPAQLKSLRVGDSVVLKASGLEDRPLPTRIEYIAPTVDLTSFTTKVRCTLPNLMSDHAGGLLKPAMFVSGTVYHADGPGIYIPATAAFYDSDGKVYVFLKTAARSFRKQEVTVGQTEPERIQIVSGLNAGDTIVADHALFLNDELQADQK